MRKLLVIITLAAMTTACAGSRGCGCPNNLGYQPVENTTDLPTAALEEHTANYCLN